MKLSIIITFYNNSKYLKNVIKNINNITEKNIEIIVIDDGSNKDELYKIEKGIKNLNKENLVFIKNSKNLGPGQAKNLGIKKANGYYVTFLDCDDYVDDNYYEVMYNYIKKLDYDIICTDIANDYGLKVEYNNLLSDNLIKRNYKKNFLKIYDIDSIIILGNKYSASACNKAIKKTILNNYEFANNRCDDLTAIIPSVVFSKKIGYIDKITYYYKQTENSLTRSNKLQNYYDSIDSLFKTVKIIKEKCDISCLELFCANNIINFIYFSIINNSFKNCIKLSSYFYKKQKYSKIDEKYILNNKYLRLMDYNNNYYYSALKYIVKNKKISLIVLIMFNKIKYLIKLRMENKK